MNPVDKKLLIRIADRMERQAKEKYDAAVKAAPARIDEARRTRDRELGDVLDLREYVARGMDGGDADAARFRFLFGDKGARLGDVVDRLGLIARNDTPLETCVVLLDQTRGA